MEVFVVILVVAVIAAVVVALTGYQSVPTGRIGLVYKRFGGLKTERYPVRVHGGQGVQAATLQADQRYLLPPLLYRIKHVERTYVPPGTIGLVIAKVGAVPPVDRTLCDHVECDYFQDGRQFLLQGGQMGKQPMFLPGGAYYDVNPALFEVITTETLGDGERYDLVRNDLVDVSIPVGATGVVIAKEGLAPDADDKAVGQVVEGHSNFQKPWVFIENGGRRGAQAETLPAGGVYRINPWFARVVIIPTRELMLEWKSGESKEAGSYDAALDVILATVEGYELKFEMSQIISIPAEAAPRLVRMFGEDNDLTGLGHVQSRAPVQRFVERVLGSTVESYFDSCASEHEVIEFVSGLNEVRMEVQSRVAEALNEWGVKAGRNSLTALELDKDLNSQRRNRAEVRDRRGTLERELENTELEQQIHRAQIDTEKYRVAAELAARTDILGVQSEVLLEALKHLKDFKTPTVIADSGAANGMLPLVVGTKMVNETLKSISQDTPPQLEPGEEVPQE